MTDPDNLRNRIADIIERVGYDWDAQMMSAVVDGKPQPPQPLADTAAQAIIDEFGLTVETHAATHAKRNMTRIISAWEWNNQ